MNLNNKAAESTAANKNNLIFGIATRQSRPTMPKQREQLKTDFNRQTDKRHTGKEIELTCQQLETALKGGAK